MKHKSSVDKNLDEVITHELIAQALTDDPTEGRTAAFEQDEQFLIPEILKAFNMDKAEIALHYASYKELQKGEHPGMQTAREGKRQLPDGRVNTQYYKANALNHLVNLLMAKEDLGVLDLSHGAQYAAERYGISVPEELSSLVGAIGLVEIAELGTMFGWPTDDTFNPDGTISQGAYLQHFVAMREKVDEDITLGVLEYSDDSPQAKAVIYRWLRLADMDAEQIGQLDAKSRVTQAFVKEHIRELLVAAVSGVGYDPREPEAIDNNVSLYCKIKRTFVHPEQKNIVVKFVNDKKESCIDQSEGVIKAVPNKGKNTCTVYHNGRTGTFRPLLLKEELTGTPVDEFIEEHTFEAKIRGQQIYEGLQQLIEQGTLPENLQRSYEMTTLFKMVGAYEMASHTPAEEGEEADDEGMFSTSEVALIRRGLEKAGFTPECCDLIMDITRDAETYEMIGASFANMDRIYGNKQKGVKESAAYKAWSKTSEAKEWRKDCRPYESTNFIGRKKRAPTLAMKPLDV